MAGIFHSPDQMTANIWCLFQPVDQEKLTASMSHFDSLTAPSLAFGCQHRVEKQKRNWPADPENGY
jgi:hypothetical protein